MSKQVPMINGRPVLDEQGRVNIGLFPEDLNDLRFGEENFGKEIVCRHTAVMETLEILDGGDGNLLKKIRAYWTQVIEDLKSEPCEESVLAKLRKKTEHVLGSAQRITSKESDIRFLHDVLRRINKFLPELIEFEDPLGTEQRTLRGALLIIQISEGKWVACKCKDGLIKSNIETIRWPLHSSTRKSCFRWYYQNPVDAWSMNVWRVNPPLGSRFSTEEILIAAAKKQKGFQG